MESTANDTERVSPYPCISYESATTILSLGYITNFVHHIPTIMTVNFSFRPYNSHLYQVSVVAC
jgi:hypothetical protein